MKKLLLMLLCSTTVFAVTAKRTPTIVPQPDGTTITVIGFGDERYNFTETPEGHVVVQASDHFYYFAQVDAAGRFIPGPYRVTGRDAVQQRALLTNIPRHLRETPTAIAERIRVNEIEKTVSEKAVLQQARKATVRGQATTLRVLILCVQFSDLAATQTAVSFQDMVNDDSWKGGIGGMSAYYKEVSYGDVSVQADYQNWVIAAQPSSYYAYSNASYSAHVRAMIGAAIDAAEANGVDFSTYDNDGDADVDGLFIVHAGPGAEEGGQTQYIWSHSSSLGSSYVRTYDGVTVNQYIIMPELYSSNHVEIGVFCHEYGHMLGLPDLYDTNGSTNGDGEGLGNWCLMAAGSWGADGNSPERPAHMSAYCKMMLGFMSPTILATSGTINVAQAETNAQSYAVWMDGSQGDEYVLIENRQQTGFDLNIPSPGLLMYHVDKNLADIWPASNAINVSTGHLGVKLYEADGREDLATGYNRGDDGDPYPGSSGNTTLNDGSSPNAHLWAGSSSGLEVSGISAAAAVMSASVTVPAYTGASLQFYDIYEGYGWGLQTTNAAYAMLICNPPVSGQLTGVRVFSYANRYTTITTQCYQNFSAGVLSSPVGSAVTVSSDAVTDFVKINFPAPIAVTEGTPVYVRIYLQRSGTGGYVMPIDYSRAGSGNSYYSASGASFVQVPYDMAARVMFSAGPLPVQLTSFTAQPVGDGVKLEWRTASEINNFGFEVQKDTMRADHVFNTIPGSFIAGSGTTLTPQTYSYTDPQATPGTWVYRLKQTDLDGSSTLSEPVIVQNIATGIDGAGSLPTSIALEQNYPNPFNPATVIPFALPEAGHVRIAVFDLLGREVAVLVNGRQEAGYHTSTFDATGLTSGAYFARMTTGSFVKTVRLMLVR
jgi:M6 family metalloprotease-like protein